MNKKPKPRKIEYVAKLDGVIVGRRLSHLPYTHAVVVQENEERERQRAYATEPDESCRKSYKEYAQIANSSPGARNLTNSWRRLSTRDIELAERRIRGKFDAYFQHHREFMIEYFEERKTKGAFEPKVERWLLQKDVAERTADYNQDLVGEHGFWKFVRIVSAESVEGLDIAKAFSKLSKSTQRTVLADVCEKMITRKAWDEIAAFLIGQLGPEDAPTVIKLVRGF
jgi:hypothetical protein